MKSYIRKWTKKNDRLSYLWLVLAFVLSLFAMNGTWDFPLAAWLYPLFLLHFTHTHRPFRGFLAASLVNAGTACVLSFQIGLGLQIPALVAMIIMAIFMSLPYLVDRLVSPRLSGIISTLIFPLSFVTADYLKTLIYPFGSVGSLAYTQYGNLPGLDPLVPGDGKVPTVTTPYGRVSNVICFDGDFPYLSRQAGQAHADLMLVPSNDWEQIDPWHTQNITFRAIENGFSLVRQTSNGLAIAVDYEGRVLGSSDYFSTDDQVVVASVPTQGTQTIYTLVGDLFAQLCIAGLLILMGFAMVQSRRPRTAKNPQVDETSPTPELSPVG